MENKSSSFLTFDGLVLGKKDFENDEEYMKFRKNMENKVGFNSWLFDTEEDKKFYYKEYVVKVDKEGSIMDICTSYKLKSLDFDDIKNMSKEEIIKYKEEVFDFLNSLES